MTDIRDFPPTTPGQLIREKVLKGSGISQDNFAEALGVSRFSVNQILNGRRGVSPEMALRLSLALGTSPELWLNLQAQVDIYNARQKLGEELGRVTKLGLTAENLSSG
jgi:addiction module HigA family antidote